VSDVELYLLQGLGEKDVEPTPTIDEYLVESRARQYRLQDERKTPWFGEACPLIRAEKVMGTSDHRRGVGTTSSMFKIPVGWPSKTVWWVVR
jgi:hypothetical protein